MITRRGLLLAGTSVAAISFAAGFPAKAWVRGSAPVVDPNKVVNVAEVTMAAPNIVRVQLNDALPTRNTYQFGLSAIPGSYTLWQAQTNPLTGLSDFCYPAGMAATNRVYNAKKPLQYLDRATAQNVANWPSPFIGGLTITAIYYANDTLENPLYTANGIGGSTTVASMALKHYLYLKLSGNLSNGGYTLKFPAALGIPDYTFNFNDKRTRCCTIKGTHIGHRPSDPLKLGYLAEWISGAPR